MKRITPLPEAKFMKLLRLSKRSKKFVESNPVRFEFYRKHSTDRFYLRDDAFQPITVNVDEIGRCENVRLIESPPIF